MATVHTEWQACSGSRKRVDRGKRGVFVRTGRQRTVRGSVCFEKERKGGGDVERKACTRRRETERNEGDGDRCRGTERGKEEGRERRAGVRGGENDKRPERKERNRKNDDYIREAEGNTQREIQVEKGEDEYRKRSIRRDAERKTVR